MECFSCSREYKLTGECPLFLCSTLGAFASVQRTVGITRLIFLTQGRPFLHGPLLHPPSTPPTIVICLCLHSASHASVSLTYCPKTALSVKFICPLFFLPLFPCLCCASIHCLCSFGLLIDRFIPIFSSEKNSLCDVEGNERRRTRKRGIVKTTTLSLHSSCGCSYPVHQSTNCPLIIRAKLEKKGRKKSPFSDFITLSDFLFTTYTSRKSSE